MTKTVLTTGTSGPYKFLNYYEERDRATLGGRDQDAMEWASRLAYHRTCVLYGKSGLGKTSLLLAGVFPLLREREYQPVYVRTLVNPTSDLLTSICQQCDVDTSSANDLNEVLRIISSQRTVVIVLDQFEEFFIRFGGSPTVRDAFIKAVSSVANDPTLDIRILFSLREDYLAQMNDFRRHLPDLLDNAYQLSPLTAFGVRQTITRPLIEAGIEYDQRLVASLIDELARFGFDPPLLQIICSEVYRQAETRTPENVSLSESDLRQVGGIEGVFRKYLDSAISNIPQEYHLVLRTVLNALITVERTKQATTQDALLEGDFMASPQEVGTVLSLLVSQRVVRKERRGRQDWYELIHERLVPIILEWLELDQEFFEFRIAKQLIDNGSRGEVWRKHPEALLNEGQITGVVGPYKERLRLNKLQSEFVLQSTLYRGCEDATYWADRYGYGRSLRILKSLLDSKDDTVRLGAALSAQRVPDPDGKLAEICLGLSLKDPNKDIQRAAGKSLASLAQQEHLEALKRAYACRTTRRNSLEVLADLFAQKSTLKEFSRYLRWRAKLLANRRIFWSNMRLIRKASSIGALNGLLTGFLWTFTVFVGLSSLFMWGHGMGVDKVEFYTILGVVSGICLLITMLLGPFLGWCSAGSLTKDLLLNKKIRWGHAVRRDWFLKIPLFLISFFMFIMALLSIGQVLDYNFKIDLLEKFGSIVVIIGIVLSALGLSVLSVFLLSLALAGCVRFSQSVIRRDATRIGVWIWAFIVSVGLPLLVPGFLATVIIAPLARLIPDFDSDVFLTVFIPAVGIALPVSFYSLTMTVAMNRSAAHIQSHSDRANLPVLWHRLLALVFPLALIIWYVYLFGYNTIPKGATPIDMSAGIVQPIKGHLGPGYPDTNYYNLRFPSVQNATSLRVLVFGGPDKLGSTEDGSWSLLGSGRRTYAYKQIPNIKLRDEDISLSKSKFQVISMFGESEMLALTTDPYDNIGRIQDYDLAIASVRLLELQQNQETQETQQAIQLEEGNMFFARCRLIYQEEKAIQEQGEKAIQEREWAVDDSWEGTPTIWWEGNFEGKLKTIAGKNGAPRLFLFLFRNYPIPPKMPDDEFVLENDSLTAIAERPKVLLHTVKQFATDTLLTILGETEHSVSQDYSSWRQVVTLDWRQSWQSKNIQVRVQDNGEWHFKLILKSHPRDTSDFDKKQKKLPKFVDVIVGLSRDEAPNSVGWPGRLTVDN